MATETFKYPDVDNPTLTLQFDTAGHLLGDKEYIVLNQSQDTTVAGGRMTASLGDNFKRYDFSCIVPLSSESETDYADILSFIGSDYANGSVNSFDWTNHADVKRTVKIVNATITIDTLFCNGTEYKRVQFVLEEVN